MARAPATSGPPTMSPPAVATKRVWTVRLLPGRPRDDVRDGVLSSRPLPRDARDKVEALHPEHARMDAQIEADAKRFADALVRAGLEPGLKLNGVEPVNALAKRYEDDVDLTL